MNELLPIRQYAASLTAAALLEIFPKVTLLSVLPRRFGFSLKATMPGGITEESFSIIEDRVKTLQKQPVKFLEMIGSNAAEFLRHKHQMERAKQAKTNNTLHLIQIGEFVDICYEPSYAPFDGYALLELNKNGHDVELIGCAHEDIVQTRDFVKNYPKYRKLDHTYQFTIIDGQIAFTPDQEQLYFDLICKWRKWVKDNGGVIYRGPKKPAGAWCATLKAIDGQEGFEGLLDTPFPTGGVLHQTPWSAIQAGALSLGLKTQEIKNAFYAFDVYGSPWKIADKNHFFTSIEKILALLLEQKIKP